MKKVTVCLIVLLFLLSCAARLAKKDTNAWLDTKTNTSELNLTGKWDAGGEFSGGWGEGNFTQEGNKISGTLGMYEVEGIVSGNEVYFVITSGGKVYYTAKLNASEGGNKFTGKACEGVIIDTPAANNATSYALNMEKVD